MIRPHQQRQKLQAVTCLDWYYRQAQNPLLWCLGRGRSCTGKTTHKLLKAGLAKNATMKKPSSANTKLWTQRRKKNCFEINTTGNKKKRSSVEPNTRRKTHFGRTELLKKTHTPTTATRQKRALVKPRCWKNTYPYNRNMLWQNRAA